MLIFSMGTWSWADVQARLPGLDFFIGKLCCCAAGYVSNQLSLNLHANMGSKVYQQLKYTDVTMFSCLLPNKKIPEML